VSGSMTVIPQFLNTLPIFGENMTYEDNGFGLGVVFGLMLLTIILYFLILRIFLFKTAWIIDKLKLDKDFEEGKLDFNVELKTILSVSIIVMGGLMFVDALPLLCKQLFVFFQQNHVFRQNTSSAWIIFELIRTIIGLLLLTNSKVLVKFILSQTEKQ